MPPVSFFFFELRVGAALTASQKYVILYGDLSSISIIGIEISIRNTCKWLIFGHAWYSTIKDGRGMPQFEGKNFRAPPVFADAPCCFASGAGG